MRWLLFVVLLAGCAYPNLTVEEYQDGSKTRRIVLRTVEYPLDGSQVTLEGNELTARIGASQDAKGIIGSKAQGRNMRLMYIVCGIICLLGIVAFALPNQIISNKDALIICGVGGVGFAVVRWVDASAPVMMWALPAVVVVVALYLGWTWLKGRS